MPAPLALGATAFFLAIDLALVAGSSLKLFDGGAFPLVLAALLFGLMTIWQRGRERLADAIRSDGVALVPFIETLRRDDLALSPRTAVYPVADPHTVPQALLHNLKHYGVLHARNIVLTVVFQNVPWVPMARRVEVQALGHGFWRVTVNFGFMNAPDVPRALSLLDEPGLRVPVFETSYFLSRETVVPAPGRGAGPWLDRVFAALSRNAGSVVEFFRLPRNAVVELGTRVALTPPPTP